jgi:hypothetical protein
MTVLPLVLLAGLALGADVAAGELPARTLVFDLSPFTPAGAGGEVIGVGTAEGEVIHARMDVTFVSNEAGPWSMGATFTDFPMGGFVGFHSEDQGWSGVGTFTAVIETDAMNGTLAIPDGASFYSWYMQWAGGAPFRLPGGGIGLGAMDGHFEVLELTLTLAPCPGGDTRLPWSDAGGALAGTLGEPVLSASGSLCPGESAALRLENALPGGTSSLVAGFALLGAAFKGGVLVPRPDVVVHGLPIDGLGVHELVLAWPTGVPGGFTFWLQHWIVDPAGPAGLAASNGVSGTTP